jgi:lysozyme family protein
MDFLKGLSTFDTFGKGWTDRVTKVKAKAMSMADEA